MRETTHPHRLLLAVTAVLTLALAGATSLAPPVADQAPAHQPEIAASARPTTLTARPGDLGAEEARLASRQLGSQADGQEIVDATLWRTRPVLGSDAVNDPVPVELPSSPDVAPVIPEAVVDPAPAAGPVADPAPVVAAVASAPAAVATPRLSIPALGINRSVEAFPCDRAAPPDNYVYRWGCAGRNNLYLLGHAGTIFKALHDAYTAGRLAVGMTATWTDANGAAQTYHVVSWRLVRPTDAAWAIAAQPVPSMTLQTCYGANSELRLLVRLVA